MSAIPPISEWPPDLRYLYEERAAICEEGSRGVSREQAESYAFESVWRDRHKLAQPIAIPYIQK